MQHLDRSGQPVALHDLLINRVTQALGQCVSIDAGGIRVQSGEHVWPIDKDQLAGRLCGWQKMPDKPLQPESECSTMSPST